MLQPGTVSSSRSSQMLTHSFVITTKGDTASMTYLKNIDSFSKTPLDSYPPNLCTLKSNPMPKPFHGCTFSVPKAYENMICNEVKRLCHLNVFASATRVNGPHLLLELPRKMVRFDLSQTSTN
jgi:hypothetical protein